jgi:hypothetical protein
MRALWDMPLCSLVGIDRRFRGGVGSIQSLSIVLELWITRTHLICDVFRFPLRAVGVLVYGVDVAVHLMQNV